MWNSKDRFRELPRCVYLTRYGKFVAKVTLSGRVHHLGTFATPDEAAQAATLFRKSHHGEFFAAP